MARRRTGLWLLVAFLALALGLWLTTRWMNRAILGVRPALTANSVLEIPLTGTVVERVGWQWGGSRVGPLTVREIDEALRRAASDDRVAAVLLRGGLLSTGFGKSQEIRAAVRAFRDSGKPVVATLEIGTLLDVYALSSADTVIMVPSGQLVLGLLAQMPYYRELLDAIGVEFEVFRTGPYKTAGNTYTERRAPEAELEAVNSLLDSIYGQIVAGIADLRDRTPEEIRTAIDRGLLSATLAQESGIVDMLGFDNDAIEHLEERIGAPPNLLSVRDYLDSSGTGTILGLGRPRTTVALIHIDGVLMPGESGDGPFGTGGVTGGDSIARHIRSARENGADALVLRVDSPGGAVTAADVIWREATLASEEMPVIVSMSDVAASGGYWIATAGTRVLADPATYTGSIGVILTRVNLGGAYEKLGIHHDLVQRGENADLLSDARRLRPELAGVFQEAVRETYSTFVERVAAGRVWTGVQALENGLVDELGGLREALSAAREAAGAPSGQRVRLRIYPAPASIWGRFRNLLTFTSATDDTILLRLLGRVGGREGAPRASLDAAREIAAALASSGRILAISDAPVPGVARW